MEVLLPLLMTLPPAALSLISICVGFSILVTSSLFIIAYSLNNSQMVAVAREELAALVLTVMIIFVWLSFDAIINTMVSGLLLASLPTYYLQTASPDSCLNPLNINNPTMPSCVVNGLTTSHVSLAIASMGILEQTLKGQYMNLYLFEALVGFLSTISFPVGSPIPAVNIVSLSIAPFAGLGMLSTAHTVVVEAIGYLLTVVWSKEFILLFARDIVPLLLLPLGLILRAFPFYRKTGSSIIALCFALYFALPFAVLLSNYMIFDIFQPADFAYNPSSASAMHTTKTNSEVTGDVTASQDESAGSPTGDMFEAFRAPSITDVASQGVGAPCAGNAIVRLFCSISNLVTGAFKVVGGFLSTVFTIWRFMIGMAGDFFFTGFNNPIMPSSASAGLFHFLILEVTTVSPFIVIIMLTTVLEIIITVTAYRSVSLMIGGEAEIIGLTKVV
ncbi:Uncharacterised protein [Candidatus Bilamarchaeum dharawalense]|uniref:Uncharacterized protein n=1 Tax=Candidatus Bilamarchaeum dharawalense TaxID=2885759 RepID=A0A5E4LNB3_9ARCH|nr:Uncharacterised protein [Candidatus Bilamarchaeum dharawalense]